MRHANLTLVWNNTEPLVKSMTWLDIWIDGMNSYMQYIDALRGTWTNAEIIQGARWVKKVCLEDRSRIVYIVLDYNGLELASIPLNFSISVAPHLEPISEPCY